MRAMRNGDIEKNEIANYGWIKDNVINWEDIEIIDKEQGCVARKIKETIHTRNKKNHINCISYDLPDISIPALCKKEGNFGAETQYLNGINFHED